MDLNIVAHLLHPRVGSKKQLRNLMPNTINMHFISLLQLVLGMVKCNQSSAYCQGKEVSHFKASVT